MVAAEFIGQAIIESSLELKITTIITTVFLFGSLILFARDYTLGVLLSFFVNFMLFIMFYLLEWAWWLPLILALMFLVILSLSLYATNKKAAMGGII